MAETCHCGRAGVFGYEDPAGKLCWYCEQHRLRQWSADARQDGCLVAEPAAQAPDLQDLVSQYGGYNKIPPEAWAEFDAAIEQWHQQRRLGGKR